MKIETTVGIVGAGPAGLLLVHLLVGLPHAIPMEYIAPPTNAPVAAARAN